MSITNYKNCVNVRRHPKKHYVHSFNLQLGEHYKMLKVNQIVVLREEYDDISLLFDPVTGKAFQLNNVATFIWQQLCLERNLDEIEISLRNEFSNTPECLKSDLNDLLRDLIENGFVEDED